MSKVPKITIKDISKQHKNNIDNIPIYTPHALYQSQHTFISYVTSTKPRSSSASTNAKMHSSKAQQAQAKPCLYYALL